MKKSITLLAVVLCAAQIAGAQDAKEQNVKTGLSFGPLPAISFDADKGFQYGALLQLYNFGDGSSYPNYKSKWYFEASWFTKGSKLYQVMYDKFDIFPGVRLCASMRYNLDSAYDFYGFNGYGTHFDKTGASFGIPDASYSTHPFFRIKRNTLLARADLIGSLGGNWKWKVGYHFTNFDNGTIDYDSINKGKDEDKQYPAELNTLLDYYTAWGIIPEEEKNGGRYSCLRAGIEYDSRDKEGAPASGIWAAAHVSLAPKWLGSSSSSYRYNLTWRQYLPLVDNNVLTFAYRLSYEGTFGNHAPYYILPYSTVISSDNDVEAFGGSKTGRGIMRSRVMGLDNAMYTAELRWRFAQFRFAKQNIALGLNAFSDGTMVVRPYDTSYNPVAGNPLADSKSVYDTFVLGQKDAPHISFGAGFRFIMNENFIIAVDYGTPLSHWTKNSPYYNQDGTGALYIGLGYLF